MISKHHYRAAVVGAALTGLFSIADATPVLSQHEIAQTLRVEDLRLENGTLVGRVVNHSDGRIEDIELRVAFEWLWQDEFHPGDGNPATSDTLALSGALAPGESEEFTFSPVGGLPQRSDGRFHPKVTVLGFTQYPSKR